MKKILFSILLAVILSACDQQTGENGQPPFKKPPELIVSSEGNKVAAVLGTYSWSYDNGDGSFTGIEADSFGPTEIAKHQSHALKTKLGSEVVLDFASIPKDLRIKIWDDKEVLREVEVEGNTFTTDEKGKIVYEIYTTWDQGAAHYAIELNVDENQPEESVDALTNQSEDRDDKAQILKVNTDLDMEHGWFIVPEGVNTMTISAEVENVETILLWISETGTGTWADRTLIGYDIDGSDGWSITWDFGDRRFHDRISIQALGSDGATQAQESINIVSIVETDSE